MTVKETEGDDVWGHMATDERWGLEPDLDPRLISTRAEIQHRRTLDAYINDRAGWWKLASDK